MSNKNGFLLFVIIIVLCAITALKLSEYKKTIAKIEHNLSYDNVIKIAKENVKHINVKSLSNEDRDVLLIHEVLVQLEVIGINEINHIDKKIEVIKKLQNEVTTNEAKTALKYYSIKHSEPMEIDYK